MIRNSKMAEIMPKIPAKFSNQMVVIVLFIIVCNCVQIVSDDVACMSILSAMREATRLKILSNNQVPHQIGNIQLGAI